MGLGLGGADSGLGGLGAVSQAGVGGMAQGGGSTRGDSEKGRACRNPFSLRRQTPAWKWSLAWEDEMGAGALPVRLHPCPKIASKIQEGNTLARGQREGVLGGRTPEEPTECLLCPPPRHPGASPTLARL